jgi:competence protein ComFB
MVDSDQTLKEKAADNQVEEWEANPATKSLRWRVFMDDEKIIGKTTPEWMPVNIVEEIVIEQVKKAIAEMGGCGCDICVSDASALALNEIPPRYVTTRKGALLESIDSTSYENSTEILVSVTKAVMKVMANPRH